MRFSLWGTPVAGAVWAVSRYSRARKLEQFESLCRPGPDDTVLDIGVSPVTWGPVNFLETAYKWPEQITGMSIDPLSGFKKSHPTLGAVQGDACHLPFVDGAFDIVFTNAVIEHVGDRDRQRRMIAECLRVSRRAVFLTAPNRWFPFDTHSGLLPFVHWLPRRVYQDLAGDKYLNLLSPRTLRRLVPPGVQARIVSPPWVPSTVMLLEHQVSK